MIKFTKACLAVVLGILLHPSGASFHLPNMDVVMRGGDIVNGMDEGQFPVFRNGRCTVRYPRNGNFATKNGFNTGGYDANQNSFCADGSASPDAMTYSFQLDGNFVARCGGRLDYVTHTGQGHEGDYFLAIDDDCILHTIKGTYGCDSVNAEEEIWTNIKLDPLKRGDRLGNGEIVRDKQAGTSLILQSSDGNLVLYESGPTGPSSNVLWAANVAPGSNVHDYFALVTGDGHLQLLGIGYRAEDDGLVSTGVYFDKDLNTGGADCFTVEYDAGVNDLVAVPCDGSRSLKLRGSLI